MFFKKLKLKQENDNLRQENKSLQDTINKLDNELQKYKQYLHNQKISNKSDKIDYGKFITKRYFERFNVFQHSSNYSDFDLTYPTLLEKFNYLLNEERIYLLGILDCLDFIINKRTKHLSTEKQLRNYLLTNVGQESIDDILSKKLENENNE